jgi:hypothetical protein
MRRNSRIGICLTAALVWVLGTSAGAVEKYLLTIVNNQENELPSRLTDSDLLTLPQVSFTTSTPWTETPATFSGPTLDSVLRYYNIREGVLMLTAVNRYEIEVPWDYIEDSSPIIANRINGEPFSIREKGPLWLIFPFDADQRYRSFEAHSMAIWQLIRIDVN